VGRSPNVIKSVNAIDALYDVIHKEPQGSQSRNVAGAHAATGPVAAAPRLTLFQHKQQ